jgi:hypothetical protein
MRSVGAERNGAPVIGVETGNSMTDGANVQGEASGKALALNDGFAVIRCGSGGTMVCSHHR